MIRYFIVTTSQLHFFYDFVKSCILGRIWICFISEAGSGSDLSRWPDPQPKLELSPLRNRVLIYAYCIELLIVLINVLVRSFSINLVCYAHSYTGALDFISQYSKYLNESAITQLALQLNSSTAEHGKS